MPHSYMVSTLSPPVIKNLVRLFYSYKCVTLFAHLCCYYSLKAACLTISRQADIFFLVCYSVKREGPKQERRGGCEEVAWPWRLYCCCCYCFGALRAGVICNLCESKAT